MAHMWEKRGLLGGHVVLEFINTIDDEGKSREINALPSWAVVRSWALAAGILDRLELEKLAPLPGQSEEGALAELLRYREAMWRSLHCLVHGQQPNEQALEAIKEEGLWSLNGASLVAENCSFRWVLEPSKFGLDIVRARVAAAFLQLMQSGELRRLRECDRCAALYIDLGRGTGRRWCRMSTCGNRNKIQRHRAGA